MRIQTGNLLELTDVRYEKDCSDRHPVDNAEASFLGYRLSDNAEQFAAEILAETPPQDLSDPANLHHGGPFAAVEFGASGLATMNVVDDTKRT